MSRLLCRQAHSAAISSIGTTKRLTFGKKSSIWKMAFPLYCAPRFIAKQKYT